MSKSAELLAEIKAGAAALGIAPTTLCQRAVKNGQLVQRLANGGSLNVKTLDAIRDYIRANRPNPSMSDPPFACPPGESP